MNFGLNLYSLREQIQTEEALERIVSELRGMGYFSAGFWFSGVAAGCGADQPSDRHAGASDP